MKDHGRDIGQSEHVRLIGRPRSPYTHRVDDTGYDTSAPLYSTIPSWSFALKYPVFCYTSIGTAVIGRIDSHWPWLNCVIGGCSGHGGCARFPSKGWFGFHSLNQFVFIIMPGFNTGSKQTTGFWRTWNNNGQPAKTHIQKIKHIKITQLTRPLVSRNRNVFELLQNRIPKKFLFFIIFFTLNWVVKKQEQTNKNTSSAQQNQHKLWMVKGSSSSIDLDGWIHGSLSSSSKDFKGNKRVQRDARARQTTRHGDKLVVNKTDDKIFQWLWWWSELIHQRQQQRKHSTWCLLICNHPEKKKKRRSCRGLGSRVF